MSIRPYLRPALALLAAYAVALQAISFVGFGDAASAGGGFVAPVCSHSGTGGTGRAPAGHGCGCVAGCLAGCCGAMAAQQPGMAVMYQPPMARSIVGSLDTDPALPLSAIGSNRSRAPPLG
jgi:hypothetical protein